MPIAQSVKVSGGAGPSPGMDVAAGSTIVVVTSGGSGSGFTPSDNGGNTWPGSPAVNFDAAGARLAMWVLQNCAAKTGYQVTVASAAGDSVFTVHEVTGVLAASLDIAATAAGSGAEPFTLNAAAALAQANNTVISAMLPYMSGDPVTYSCNTGYALAAQENNNNSFYGQGVASKSVTSTTAPSAQWDTAGATGDVFVGIIALKEAATGGTSIAPGVGSIAISGYAPTIAQPKSLAPGPGALTLTGFAPTVGQPHGVAPAAGTLTLTGYAPTVAQPHSAVPGTGAIAITGYAPTVTQSGAQNVASGAGAVVLTGYAPTVTQGSPAPEPTRNAGFEVGPRFVSFKPLLQRILEARAERRVKPAKDRAAKRAKIIEVQAAELVLKDDGAEERFRELMAGWLAQRPLIPPMVAQVDPMQLFMAQVAFRIQQMQAEEQARTRLAAQDEEEALIALLLA